MPTSSLTCRVSPLHSFVSVSKVHISLVLAIALWALHAAKLSTSKMYAISFLLFMGFVTISLAIARAVLYDQHIRTDTPLHQSVDIIGLVEPLIASWLACLPALRVLFRRRRRSSARELESRLAELRESSQVRIESRRRSLGGDAEPTNAELGLPESLGRQSTLRMSSYTGSTRCDENAPDSNSDSSDKAKFKLMDHHPNTPNPEMRQPWHTHNPSLSWGLNAGQGSFSPLSDHTAVHSPISPPYNRDSLMSADSDARPFSSMSDEPMLAAQRRREQRATVISDVSTPARKSKLSTEPLRVSYRSGDDDDDDSSPPTRLPSPQPLHPPPSLSQTPPTTRFSPILRSSLAPAPQPLPFSTSAPILYHPNLVALREQALERRRNNASQASQRASNQSWLNSYGYNFDFPSYEDENQSHDDEEARQREQRHAVDLGLVSDGEEEYIPGVQPSQRPPPRDGAITPGSVGWAR